MKKEHNVKDIPFKQNLVFYVPCEGGSLMDKVGGSLPHTSSGCSITWDGEMKTYRFYANGTYKYAGLWQLKEPLDVYNGCTLFVDGEVLVDYGNKYNCYISCDELQSGRDNVNFGHYRLTHYTRNDDRTIIPDRHKFVCTWNDGYLRTYQDGVFCFEQSWPVPLTPNPATGIAVAQIHTNNYEFEMAV